MAEVAQAKIARFEAALLYAERHLSRSTAAQHRGAIEEERDGEALDAMYTIEAFQELRRAIGLLREAG